MTDQDIVQLIREKKHSKAFGRLYGYFPVIEKHILKNGGDKDIAADIYQDALVILCRKVENAEFKLTSSLNTYVFSIVRHLWNDELKKRKREQPMIGELSENAITEHEWENDVLENQKANLAVQALNSIGARCKQLLLLFYTENKSMKDIAKKMEFSSEKIAKNQKYKCLEKAKALLNDLVPKN